MKHRALRSIRRFPFRFLLALFLLAGVCLCAAIQQSHILALTCTLCVATVSGSASEVRLRLKVLLRAARLTGRDFALARTMAAASRQPFFFCCPMRNAGGTLEGLSVKFVNAAACRALGIPGKRLRGAYFLDLVQATCHTRLLLEASAVLASQQAADVSLSFLAQEGQVEEYVVRLIPLADGVAITTLQSREEELAERRAAAAYQFTQSVLESAPVSIITTDAEGRILAINAAGEQLTQYSRHELCGVHSILALHDAVELSTRRMELPDPEGGQASEGFRALTEVPAGSTPDREWTYIRRDGSRTWVSVTMSPLKDPAGETSGYLAIAFDVSERKRLAEAAHHMAHHDQLTQLPNRSQLYQSIESSMKQARLAERGMAVFVVDLDHFKRINDSLGHAGGDAVLVTAANRLLGAVRTTDKVIRVGGDEFVLVLPELDDEDQASQRAAVLLEALSQPFLVGTREIRVTASIGYCLVTQEEVSAKSLLRRADLAMYAAKSAGRNSFRAYTWELQQETADRLEMEEDLRHAIERGELALHYQPQVTCAGREVTGMEMLLRWSNPKRGDVPPDVFISVAEEAGLMSDIGRWALRRACIDCVTAQAAVGQRLKVAVNLSAREFLNASLPAIVGESLQTSGLQPGDLELEITEQVLMSATPCLLNTLSQLRELGVCLAIDDFGTGFSNFSYILQYHVDRLKIDRSFISRVPHDPGAAAIVRSVIAMAHGLGMRVCAEGVETSEQLEFLGRRRCDDIQGWLFSKAVPLGELAEVIRAIQAEPSRIRRLPHRAVSGTRPAFKATNGA